MNAPTEGELPETIADEEALEELLSRPTPETIAAVGELTGTLAIIGGGGKIGPSLTRMACRARDEAGADLRVLVVDRFPDASVRDRLAAAGAETATCDLLDPSAVADLPDAGNVVYMVGMKFGTAAAPALTWAINTVVPAHVARRYRGSRMAAFSTGCVYEMVPAESDGSVETDPLTPVGEYANSCVGRERVLEHFAATDGTPMVLVRLNYAVEMRYGVLVDLAQAVLDGREIDVTTGWFNVLWQGDVNASVLRLLGRATSPATAINLTGPEKLSTRRTAARLGELTGREVRFAGAEAATAWLSDASRARELLGPPRVDAERVIRWTARWIADGGPTLGKPTHFQERGGEY